MLYHQVHPLKLATDILTAALSLVLLAQHRPWTALLIMWVPSVIASALLVRWVDFSRTRNARVGSYLRRYMTRSMEGVRFAGLGVAVVGAWYHVWWLIPVGSAVVVCGWFGPWCWARLRGAQPAPALPGRRGEQTRRHVD
ncbi:MAG: hypothetical protein ABI895_43430 [Deltaproteobacteria bacterium]